MAFLKAAVETVGKLASPIEREIYGNKAAAAAGISGASFAQEVERWRKAVSYTHLRVGPLGRLRLFCNVRAPGCGKAVDHAGRLLPDVYKRQI